MQIGNGNVQHKRSKIILDMKYSRTARTTIRNFCDVCKYRKHYTEIIGKLTTPCHSLKLVKLHANFVHEYNREKMVFLLYFAVQLWLMGKMCLFQKSTSVNGMHREQWIVSDNEWTNKERLEIEQLERDTGC
jgi:hypothetical protein